MDERRIAPVIHDARDASASHKKIRSDAPRPARLSAFIAHCRRRRLAEKEELRHAVTKKEHARNAGKRGAES